MTTSHLPEYDDLLASYALGALEGPELEALEGHLQAGCEQCEQALLEWRQAVETVAHSVLPARPSPEMRSKVLSSVRAFRKAPGHLSGGGARLRSLRWLPLAAALMAVAISAGTWTSQRQSRIELDTLTSENERLQSRLTALTSEINRARFEVARLASTLRHVNSPQTRSVVLAGLEAAPRASANVYVRPAVGQAVFFAYELPELSSDQTYQLWIIGEEGPVSAGVFGVEDDGSAVVDVRDLPPAAAALTWAVTVEPAGGLALPSGAMVLRG